MSEEQKNVTVNKEYKDRLFNFIFGNPENRKWTLSLYNAINGSDYTDENAIEINTIKEVLYLGMHNDTSFLLSDTMNIYEHQLCKALHNCCYVQEPLMLSLLLKA